MRPCLVHAHPGTPAATGPRDLSATAASVPLPPNPLRCSHPPSQIHHDVSFFHPTLHETTRHGPPKSKDHGPEQRRVGHRAQSVLGHRPESSKGLLLVLGHQPPVMVHDLFDLPGFALRLSFEGQDAPGLPVVQVLRRVVRSDTCEAPVARFVVLPQPGLARDQAAQTEEREAAEQLQEAALAAHVGPGPRRQPTFRVRPSQRLIVQGVALRVARPLPLLPQGPHAAGQLGDQPGPHLLPRHGWLPPPPPPEEAGVPCKGGRAGPEAE